MADTEYKRVIQSAKERALFGFLALVQRAMQEADSGIVQLLNKAKSGYEQTSLASIRHFLQQDGNVLLRRVDALFRGYLDRAMQTMYTDLRSSMDKVSATELSLIDDEVVNLQLEVGRLAQRMRDTSEENITRLNIIIARLHGEREPRERENPFRPYLLARSLYESVRETIPDEPQSRLLFEHLSNALVKHLPGYYTAIREVFDASGIQTRLTTTPPRMTRYQRYFGAPPANVSAVLSNLQAYITPSLHHLREMQLPAQPDASIHALAASQQVPKVQDFLHKLFNQTKSSTAPLDIYGPGTRRAEEVDTHSTTSASKETIDQLHHHQRQAAHDSTPADHNRLFVLREALVADTASPEEQIVFDLVAVLFEFVLKDEKVSAQLREKIGRLQIPFLKAALLEPKLLYQEEHPARQLLNRLSTAAAGLEISADCALAAEIDRIIENILEQFDTDLAIFSNHLTAFEAYLRKHVRHEDLHMDALIETVEVSEKMSVLISTATDALCDLILPLNCDKRISDFIIHVWPHVLAHAAWQDAQMKVASDSTDSLYRQYSEFLPELIWSTQDKQDAQERTALIRLLPNLVKRLKNGLHLIQMPDDECKHILDELVEIHTKLLRTPATDNAKKLPTLDALRQLFAQLVIVWDRVYWMKKEPPQARAAVIEDVLASKRMSVVLSLGNNVQAPSEADQEFLAQTYLLGTRVELCAGEDKKDARASAQLVWVSTHRSLYLFKLDHSKKFVIHTCSSLLEALQQKTILPLEYAPVFERAVDALLFGMEALNKQHP